MASKGGRGQALAGFANAASSILGYRIEQQVKSVEEERKARNDFASRLAEAMIQYQGASPQEAFGAFQQLRGANPSVSGGLTGQGTPQGLAGVVQQHIQASQPGPVHPVMSDEEYRKAGYKATHEYEYYPNGRVKGMKKNYTYVPPKSVEPTVLQLIGAEGTLGKVSAARTGGFFGIGGHPTVNPAEIEALRGLLGQAVRRATSKQGAPPFDPTIQALEQQGYTIESIDE